MTSDADLASVPFSLGGALGLVPSLDGVDSPYGPGPLAGPAAGAAVPGSTYSFLDRGAAPAYDPSPRSGFGAAPTAAAPVSAPSAAALPFAFDVSVLDLSGLAYQHSTGLGAPASGLTGVRPFDP
jgi:hypothetical protein